MTDNSTKKATPLQGKETSGTTLGVDPFDPAQFRVSNTLSPGGEGIRREITHIKTGKPPRSSFFQSRPGQEYTVDCFMLEDDLNGMKDTYLVLPGVADAIIEEVKAKRIKLCVTRHGVPFLWEIARPLGDGFSRRNLWHETALAAADMSERKWTRVVANMTEGAYTIHTSESADEPEWPALTMQELLKLAYGEDRTIRDANHPLIRRLLGRD